MRNLQQINRDISRLDQIGYALAALGIVIGLLMFAYGALGLYYIQKNSPERELQANAQTTNA